MRTVEEQIALEVALTEALVGDDDWVLSWSWNGGCTLNHVPTGRAFPAPGRTCIFLYIDHLRRALDAHLDEVRVREGIARFLHANRSIHTHDAHNGRASCDYCALDSAYALTAIFAAGYELKRRGRADV